MNKTLTSVSKFLLIACPALISFNSLQARTIQPTNPAPITMTVMADSSINESTSTGGSFSAGDCLTANTCSVDISWITPDDSTTDHFEIERSFDATNFQMVAMIFTSDDRGLAANHYSFSDQSERLVQHPAAYYRVKQVDIHGNSTYSAVQQVSLLPVTPSKSSTVAPDANPYHAEYKSNNAAPNQPVITALNSNGHKAA